MEGPRAKLYTLEIGRFIAAFLVMLCHAGYFIDDHTADPSHPFFGGISFPGQLGVQYFFVLSGFVMASAHYRDFGHVAAIPKFWWRRICRIYPAYWLALIIPVYYAGKTLTLGGFTQVTLLSPWHDHELILAAWSLRYELVFYIMLGLAMLPYIGKPLLAFWVFFTFWRWSLLDFLHFHPPVLFTVNHYVATYAEKFAAVFEIYFFMGLAAGYAYAKRRFSWQICISLLLPGILLFCYQLPREDWGIGYGTPADTTAMGFALACVIFGLAGLERAGHLRPHRLAGLLGSVSYPLYVVHVPLLMLADHALHGRTLSSGWQYTSFLLINLATLIIALAVTLLFDQPIQRALRRLTRPRSAVGASVKGQGSALDPLGP